MLKKIIFILISTLLVLSLNACTKSSGDDDDNGSDNGNNDNPSGNDSDFRSDCGTVVSLALQNPVNGKDGKLLSARSSGPNLVVLNTAEGEKLVKLQNISAPDSNLLSNIAVDLLEEQIAGGVVYFEPDVNCVTTLSGGGQALVGSIYTPAGKNIAEVLLNRGVVEVDQDICGGELLTSCYDALLDEAKSKSAGQVEELLWKPVSESDGKLVVLSDVFGGTTIVSGETGNDGGPSNGYGSTVRFSKPGCAYGSATVEIRDEEGRRYNFGANTSLTIPNGCQRFCYNSGTLTACTK